jgi:hypothetical protein
MKILLFIIFSILVSNHTFGQGPTKNKSNNPPGSSKESDSLKAEVLRLQADLDKSVRQVADLKQAKLLNNTLQLILRGYNSTFELSNSLEEIYTENFFLTWKYQKLEPSDYKKMESANLIAEGLFYSEPQGTRYQILGKAVLDFNRNRAVLDSLTKQVLEMPFDSVKTETAIRLLEQLPKVKESSKLSEYKENIKSRLTDYAVINCLAFTSYSDLAGKVKFYDPKTVLKEKPKLSEKYNQGISPDYAYLWKVFDAILQDSSNFNKPEYAIPNSCPAKPALVKELPIPESESMPQENNK